MLQQLDHLDEGTRQECWNVESMNCNLLVTFTESSNQSSIKPCRVVHLVVLWTLIYLLAILNIYVRIPFKTAKTTFQPLTYALHPQDNNYVNCLQGDPYWEKLYPRSWVLPEAVVYGSWNKGNANKREKLHLNIFMCVMIEVIKRLLTNFYKYLSQSDTYQLESV